MLPSGSTVGLATAWTPVASMVATFMFTVLLCAPFCRMRSLPLSASAGTRIIMRRPRLITTGAARSPSMATGRRKEMAPRFVPIRSISPPGNAALGSTESMRGAGPVSDLNGEGIRLPPVMHNQSDDEGINSRGQIIHHDTQTAVQSFKLPHRRRFKDIEEPKKHEGQDYMPGFQRNEQ